MENLFVNTFSPLDQFEVRSLVSLVAPILGNLSVSSKTNFFLNEVNLYPYDSCSILNFEFLSALSLTILIVTGLTLALLVI